MNYTEIKRLFQNNTEFVPITLAEAVVVNTSTIPGLTALGITTLDKVLRSTLGLVGKNAEDIQTVGGNLVTLTGVVQQINTELENKQDKLTAGVGISINKTLDGKTVISTTHTLDIYKVVTAQQWAALVDNPSEDYQNVIYLVPQPPSTTTTRNVFKEFLCIKEDDIWKWEEFGTIQTDVDLSDYATTEQLTAVSNRVTNIEVNGVFAEQVFTSTGQQVLVSYTIPSTLYDSAVNVNETDLIEEENGSQDS